MHSHYWHLRIKFRFEQLCVSFVLPVIWVKISIYVVSSFSPLFSCPRREPATALYLPSSLTNCMTDSLTYLLLFTFCFDCYYLQLLLFTIATSYYCYYLLIFRFCEILSHFTLETLLTCDTWDTDYIADNWEQHY